MAAVIPVVQGAALVSINPGDQAVNVLDFTVSDDNKFYQKAIRGLDEVRSHPW
jgi:hypothetical protein